MYHQLSVPGLSLSPSANSSVTDISTADGVDTTAAALLKTHRRDQTKEGHRSNRNRGGAGRGKPGRCSLSLSLSRHHREVRGLVVMATEPGSKQEKTSVPPSKVAALLWQLLRRICCCHGKFVFLVFWHSTEETKVLGKNKPGQDLHNSHTQDPIVTLMMTSSAPPLLLRPKYHIHDPS